MLSESGVGYVTFKREPGGRDQFGHASTVRAVQHLCELRHARPNITASPPEAFA